MSFLGDAWDKTRSITNSLPIVGGLSSAIFGDPNQEDHQKQMEAAAQRIKQYRPMAMQGRMNAMNQGSLAFNPLNELMSQMYGPGARQDIQGMNKNPLPRQEQDRAYMEAFGHPAPPSAPPPNYRK